jgi:hypothetical protein
MRHKLEGQGFSAASHRLWMMTAFGQACLDYLERIGIVKFYSMGWSRRTPKSWRSGVVTFDIDI